MSGVVCDPEPKRGVSILTIGIDAVKAVREFNQAMDQIQEMVARVAVRWSGRGEWIAD